MERHKQQVVGPLYAVPCSWCGQKNDLREINEQFPLEVGVGVECDHCQKISTVSRIDRAPRIGLKQKHK